MKGIKLLGVVAGLSLLGIHLAGCGASAKDWACECTQTCNFGGVFTTSERLSTVILNQSKKDAEALCDEYSRDMWTNESCNVSGCTVSRI